MTFQDVATTVGSLIMLAASAAAGVTIWVLVTAPATMAGVAGGGEQPLTIVARAILSALAQLIRYL